MKKNNSTNNSTNSGKSSVGDVGAGSVGDIETLNALYATFTKAATAVAVAYEAAYAKVDERLDGKRKSYDAAKARFELFRTQMKLAGTPTKFDMASGRYFEARTKDGREVFHVELQEVRSAVVEIAAESREKAVQAALAMAKDGQVKLTAKPMEAADVSR